MNDSSRQAFDAIKHFNKKTQLRATFRSTFSTWQRGASVISDASASLRNDTVKLMRNDRIESFDEAMDRLVVYEDDLPLIHNQILMMVYLCFSLAILALCFGIYHGAKGNMFPALVSVIISLACFFNFAKCVLRTLQIRLRSFVGVGFLLGSPEHWLPSRLRNVRKMSISDPLKHKDILAQLSKQARKSGFVSFSAGVVSAISFTEPSGLIPSAWSVVCLVVSFLYLSSFAFYSAEVFRRARGEYVDIGMWLMSPSAWIPSNARRSNV